VSHIATSVINTLPTSIALNPNCESLLLNDNSGFCLYDNGSGNTICVDVAEVSETLVRFIAGESVSYDQLTQCFKPSDAQTCAGLDWLMKHQYCIT
jgi:hypothetical protein